MNYEKRKKLIANIRVLMVEKKINQKTLAEMSGVTEPVISNYLTCKRTPRIDALEMIAKALDTTIDELLK